MLSSEERRRLADMAVEIARADRRFADGLRDGRPCAPRELRWGAGRITVFLLTIAVLTVSIVLAATGVTILGMCSLPAVGIALGWVVRGWYRC
jgi:hypothetical protein